MATTTIAWLEKKIAEGLALLDTQEDASADAAEKLSLLSLESYVKDLQAQLQSVKEARHVEVLELRFAHIRGSHTGTVPLDFLARLSGHLSGTLHGVARYLAHATYSGAVPASIINHLDLQLAGLEPGSTRLFITGRTAPTLFGDSLIEESLEKTFEVLEADTATALIAAAAEIGPQSTKSLRKLLLDLGDSESPTTLVWNQPAGERKEWSRTPEEAQRLAESLGAIERVAPEEIELVGEAITLSSRRMFEIETSPGAIVQARVSDSMRQAIGKFHVGQRLAARLRREVMRNKLTGDEREVYFLLSLAGA